MNRILAVAMLSCVLVTSAWAHRLDEYLQATMLSVEPGVLHVTVRLVPGVAVATAVIAGMDANHDGEVDEFEQRAYADRLMGDLSIGEDGRILKPHRLSASFPTRKEMRSGTGEVQITFDAALVPAPGIHRITFVNRHEPGISVYLINTLVPQDKNIRIEGQDRDVDQSRYGLTFTISGSPEPSASGVSWGGIGGAFMVGVHHIAGGADHLLFLISLLLPAPLLAISGRWSSCRALRGSLTQVFCVVTAFTVGHSISLAAATFGWLHASSRPVEVLIALSIFVAAVNVLRPLFPGREAWVAGLFGLIHGLAFASALDELGATGAYKVVSLLGFNLGIEGMQLLVVAAAFPLLWSLSRTSSYRVFRPTAGLLAIFMAVYWMIDRLLDRSMSLAIRNAHWMEYACAAALTLITGWVVRSTVGRRGARFISFPAVSKQLILIATTILAIAGCASTHPLPQPEDTLSELQTALGQLSGSNIHSVIDRLGSPNGFQEIDGDNVYTWSTIQVLPSPSSEVPAIELECMIRIGTDHDGTIRNTHFTGKRGGCRRYAHALIRPR